MDSDKGVTTSSNELKKVKVIIRFTKRIKGRSRNFDDEKDGFVKGKETSGGEGL